MIDASRGVTCGIVSIPVVRSIAIAAMSADSRARAIGLSLMSTASTTPEAFSFAATRASTPCSCPWAGRARRTRPTRPRRACARAASSLLLRADRGDLGRIAVERDERDARLALLLDRRADRRDLRGAGAAAAADDPRAEVARLRGELGEVVGRRVRIDDAAAAAARQPDVRLRREREPVRRLRPSPRARRAPRPGRRRSSRRRRRRPAPRAARRIAGRDAGERLGVLVEGELGDDRQRRDGPHRGHGRLELLEVEERLDHEQVDAAPLEEPRLLEEDVVGVLAAVRAVELAERADRAGDEDLLARRSRAPRARASRRSRRSPRAGRRAGAPASLRRFAPNVFASISSAPAAMNAVWTAITASGARTFASSGARSLRHAAGQERARSAVADDRPGPCCETFEKAAHAASLWSPRRAVQGRPLARVGGPARRPRPRGRRSSSSARPGSVSPLRARTVLGPAPAAFRHDGSSWAIRSWSRPRRTRTCLRAPAPPRGARRAAAGPPGRSVRPRPAPRRGSFPRRRLRPRRRPRGVRGRLRALVLGLGARLGLGAAAHRVRLPRASSLISSAASSAAGRTPATRSPSSAYSRATASAAQKRLILRRAVHRHAGT